MGLIARTRDALAGESRDMSLDAYAALVSESIFYNGQAYALGQSVQQTLAGGKAERIGVDFRGLSQAAYGSNGIVFACMLNRQLVFSTIKFKFRNESTSELFGDSSLALLERPWPGGTTQDLLTRVINDADLAGNSFHTVETSLATLGGDGGKQVVRLRPDWTGVVVGQRRSGLGSEKLGYVYQDGGLGGEGDEVYLLPDEVSHYAPIVDPLTTHTGMSWLTPVIREMQADQLMNTHKRAFFENGATPNMIIKHPVGASPESVKRFDAMIAAKHGGALNAYKRLNLYPGADATVVGTNFQQLEFAVTQGHGETRIAAAAGIPPVIVGLSEGLAAATYSNYGQARRRFADGTMHPLWQNVAGSFAPLLRGAPPLRGVNVRLWYDATGVPFLREDEKDAADIQATQAQTMAALVREGFEWESVKLSVISGDWRNLKHSGLTSVQLQKPGAQDTTLPPADTPPEEGQP